MAPTPVSRMMRSRSGGASSLASGTRHLPVRTMASARTTCAMPLGQSSATRAAGDAAMGAAAASARSINCSVGDFLVAADQRHRVPVGVAENVLDDVHRGDACRARHGRRRHRRQSDELSARRQVPPLRPWPDRCRSRARTPAPRGCTRGSGPPRTSASSSRARKLRKRHAAGVSPVGKAQFRALACSRAVPSAKRSRRRRRRNCAPVSMSAVSRR